LTPVDTRPPRVKKPVRSKKISFPSAKWWPEAQIQIYYFYHYYLIQRSGIEQSVL
jgi:hypothetical protein